MLALFSNTDNGTHLSIVRALRLLCPELLIITGEIVCLVLIVLLAIANPNNNSPALQWLIVGLFGFGGAWSIRRYWDDAKEKLRSANAKSSEPSANAEKSVDA